MMADHLTVNLKERSYRIGFGTEMSDELRTELATLRKAGRRAAVLADQAVHQLHAGWLKDLFAEVPTSVLPSGEATKSIGVLGQTWDFLAREKLDRHSALFVIGGGVIGDLGGFAAASYLRGIDFYQVPTTLLAMVDSSVGGKTGLNLAAGKNLVGAFHQPRGVFIATRFLTTLPPREFAAGAAEIVKYGLLGDAQLFARLERDALAKRSDDWAEVIRRCCEMKARIVEADERELAREGGRALLNLGHTFGHAIEQVTGYGAYLHGEAVAIGLCAAARLSQKLGHLRTEDVSRVDRAVALQGLPVRLREALPLADLFSAMARDKKVRAGLPRFVVLKKLGEAATQDGIAPALVETAFREVGAV
jgi:3-dehydroquinate synthase